MNLRNKAQIDIINDLGFDKSAVSTWCNGTRLPRMDKIDALADYFGVTRADLIEDKTTSLDQQLSPESIEILERYDKLNNIGKEKLRDYADDLSCNPKYTENTERKKA